MTRDWRPILEKCWGPDTSATPDWPQDCPSNGQCAVTALVIQDYEGGILQRVRTLSGSHYYNRLADGTDVDMTRDQFGPNEEFGAPSERTRAYVLSYASTRARYQLLADRVAKALEGVPSTPFRRICRVCGGEFLQEPNERRYMCPGCRASRQEAEAREARRVK